MYEILFTKKAEKELGKLAYTDSQRLIQKLQKLSYPFVSNFDIVKMGGYEVFYRLRVGKVRAIFELDHKNKEIWIRKIKYRGSAYKF